MNRCGKNNYVLNLNFEIKKKIKIKHKSQFDVQSLATIQQVEAKDFA